MKVAGAGRPKFVCGVAANRSATRLPTSCGDVPAGHFVKAFCAMADTVRMTAHTIKDATLQCFRTLTPPSWVRLPKIQYLIKGDECRGPTICDFSDFPIRRLALLLFP